MSVTDKLLQNNAAYAENLEKGNLPLPAKGVAVVACIDFRLNVYGMLRLQEGGARVIGTPAGDNGRRDPVPGDQPAPVGDA